MKKLTLAQKIAMAKMSNGKVRVTGFASAPYRALARLGLAQHCGTVLAPGGMTYETIWRLTWEGVNLLVAGATS